MKKIFVDELKRLQLDLLSDIHDFCVNNDIKYSLAYGTLLGAVRHKGYIPWDDDIDILMRREDYERFIKIYHHKYYAIVDTTTLKGYYLPFAKLCDMRTVMQEKNTQKAEIGVYVDIFPVDNMPDSENELNVFFFKKKLLNAIHNLKIVAVDKNRELSKNLILALSHVILAIIPISIIVDRMKSISEKYKDVCTKRRAVFVTADNKRKWVLPKEIYDEYIEISFEGKTFMAIKEVDRYLAAMYGDYMILPSEDKRVSHHAFNAYWK